MDEIGPDADLSFQSFIGHDFRDMDLSGVNFRRAILDRCNFHGPRTVIQLPVHVRPL